MWNQFKYHLVLIFVIVLGGLVVRMVLISHEESELKLRAEQLDKIHKESVQNIRTGSNTCLTIVSSIRSFVRNSDEIPDQYDMQKFVKDLCDEIDFKDSIVVSFLSPDHEFLYSVTPNQIDPYELSGLNVGEFRTEEEILRLDRLMEEDNIEVFPPLNLVEGWAGFPYNFGVKLDGQSIGYIAPIIDAKYLLDHTYPDGKDSAFVHRFNVIGTGDVSREAVHDGSEIYHGRKDQRFYADYDIEQSEFVYDSVKLHNIEMQVGTAFVQKHKPNRAIVWVTFLWYILLISLVTVTAFQWYRNVKTNMALNEARRDVEDKNEKLEDNLLEIQTLLKEVHHRVKNNMQIISSLLNLQKYGEEEERVVEALEASKTRIQSMALVHERLYSGDNISSINFKEYLQELSRNVAETFYANSVEVKLELDVSDCYFDVDTAVPLGLIVNELLTNSYKHAFSDVTNPRIRISVIPVEEHGGYYLIYSDNGPGIPDHIDFDNCGTLGLELVHILVNQLKGAVSYNKENESTFRVRFAENTDHYFTPRKVAS